MTPAPTPNKTEKKASSLATLLAYIQRQGRLLALVTLYLFLGLYLFLCWIFRDKKIVERLFAYTQRQWRPLALVVLYIFFRSTFEDRVASLLESFDPSLGSFVIWLLLIVIALVYTYILSRRRYVLSEGLRAWTVVMFAGWAYYRFVGTTHYVATPTLIPSTCYMDLFLILCVCVAFIAGWSHWMRRKSKIEVADNSRAGYHVELPCTSKDEDLLGRREEAEALAEKIFQTDTSRGAFTLGLTAPWGAGKTSFMLVMKEYLERQPEEKVIVIEFNPWRYRKAPNLTQIFFEELSHALAPYNSALSSGFVHYVDHLLAKDSNPWLQLASRLLPQESNVKSTGEQYDFLKREISKLGRKIFIFIDDVDRLEREELVELFALVRNSSSFPYMSYILTYDKEYVASQLKGYFDQHTYRYMEKIVQEEYPLAKITPEQIERALNKGLKEIGHADLLPSIKALQIQPIDHIPTIRSVKRICNCILSFPQELRGNVEFLDWFILELIRIQYPRLFEFLRGNYMTVFVLYGDGRVVSLVNREKEDLQGLFHETEQTVDFAKYLHENQVPLELENPSSTLRLIESLWGSKRDKKPMQVNDDKYIGIYFYRTLQEDDIKVAEFRQFLTLSIHDTQSPPMKRIKPYVDQIYASSRREKFCEMVWKQEANNLNEVVNMLYIAFYLVALDEWLDQEQKTKISNWINQIYESLEPSVSMQILCGVSVSLGIHKGILLYLSSVINGAEQLPIPFTREELEGIKEKLFLDYTEDATSIDPIACYRLWLQCQTHHKVKLHGGDIRPRDPKKTSHRMNERMKGIIEENIEQLIPYFVILGPLQDSLEHKHYKPYWSYPLWTLDPGEANIGISDFSKFILELSPTSSLVIEEFQRFLRKWLDYIARFRTDLSSTETDRGKWSEYDQYWAELYLRRSPEYYQGLQQHQFFEILRYQVSDAFGFIPFDFKIIQPKNIWSVSTSTEDCAIEL